MRELLASFDRQPDAAAHLDGLNLSAVDTAKMLRSRLVSPEFDEAARVLGVSRSTIESDWRMARAWLTVRLSRGIAT